MIEEAKTKPINLPKPAEENREMVPGLRIIVRIHRTDEVGLEVEASILMTPSDRTPFNRINEELRRQFHDDMDRLMNDVNRIWNKSFRDQEQVLAELHEKNPLMGLLMKALGGEESPSPEELQKALDKNKPSGV